MVLLRLPTKTHRTPPHRTKTVKASVPVLTTTEDSAQDNAHVSTPPLESVNAVPASHPPNVPTPTTRVKTKNLHSGQRDSPGQTTRHSPGTPTTGEAVLLTTGMDKAAKATNVPSVADTTRTTSVTATMPTAPRTQKKQETPRRENTSRLAGISGAATAHAEVTTASEADITANVEAITANAEATTANAEATMRMAVTTANVEDITHMVVTTTNMEDITSAEATTTNAEATTSVATTTSIIKEAAIHKITVSR